MNKMTPDESAAALSLATEMSQGLMPKAPMGQEPQGAPGAQQAPQPQQAQQAPQEQPQNDPGEYETKLKDISSEVESMKREFKSSLQDLSDSIKKALENDQEG